MANLEVKVELLEDSIIYWINRFKNKQIQFRGPYKRFEENEQVITFNDPDGLELELVAHKSSKERDTKAWKEGPIPSSSRYCVKV